MISSMEWRDKKLFHFLELIKTNQSYIELRQTIGFGDRLYGLETGFLNNGSKIIY